MPNADSVRQRRKITTPAASSHGDCNGLYLDTLLSIYWRTSLVPAPAVIPAPRAYINVVAVKKLVVGLRGSGDGWDRRATFRGAACARRLSRVLTFCGSDCRPLPPFTGRAGRPRSFYAPSGTSAEVTVSKAECSKHPTRLGEC